LQTGDLNQVVTRAIEGLQPKLQPGGFFVKTLLDHSLDPIKLDLDLLEQTLAHLMEHAWLQMGKIGELEVGTRRNGSQATVTLGYPAPKLSEEDLEQFFYPFALDDPPGKGEPVSDRVDVSLAKIVISQHGGVIKVIKENAQRIKITISFPLAS
jgi:K+-sensing histidine kinase KdpD